MATHSTSTGVPYGRAPARGQAPDIVREYVDSAKKPSQDDKPGKEIVRRRHQVWKENQINWKWLMDSYTAGKRYREATYGPDRRGLPLRNLIRHKREYPDSQLFPNNYQGFAGTGSVLASAAGVQTGPWPGMLGAHQNATAWDDDFEYRRARTPVPEFVMEAIEIHLGKIYGQNVTREGPPELMDWWKDVDNAGTSADRWFKKKAAPLLLQLGCLDIVCDRPAPPPGAGEITNEQQVKDHGLDRCAVSMILPQNMVWWRNDPAKNYLECLVREFCSADDDPEAIDDESDAGNVDTVGGGSLANPHAIERFRHWTAEGWTLYSADGDLLDRGFHDYGRVPIHRYYDIELTDEMLGKSQYESTAACQAEFYNRDSELVLNDTLQSSPILSMPEEFCKGDQTIAVGIGNVLPMKRLGQEGDQTGYQAPVYVSPPKDPAESLRTNKNDIRDVVDRRNCLTKIAGTPGTTGGTVAQSGISKQHDAHSAEAKLNNIAETLAIFERGVAEQAMLCINNRLPTRAERAAIKVVYANRYQLRSATDLLNDLNLLAQAIQMIEMAATGEPTPAEGSNLSPGGQQPAKKPGASGTTPTSKPATAPSPPSIPDLQKSIVASRKCPMPTFIGQILMEVAGAMLNNPDEITKRQIKEEIGAWVLTNRIVQPGVESNDEAFAGSGSDESRGGEDPTGVTASTAVSPSAPAVLY